MLSDMDPWSVAKRHEGINTYSSLRARRSGYRDLRDLVGILSRAGLPVRVKLGLECGNTLPGLESIGNEVAASVQNPVTDDGIIVRIENIVASEVFGVASEGGISSGSHAEQE